MRRKLGLPPDADYYHGEGCDQCNQTGYKGREALFEILNIDQEISRLITEEAGEDAIREAAGRRGFSTLRERGLEKVKQGITTPEEVLSNTVGSGDQEVREGARDESQEEETPADSGVTEVEQVEAGSPDSA
jgi:hypothetical protein